MYDIEKISNVLFKINKIKDGYVDIFIYSSEKLLNKIKDDETLKQILDVSKLNGVKALFLMPDAHQGYGFPIGSVAVFDENKGVISPGGVGYDINCGVRLMRLSILLDEFKTQLKRIAEQLHLKIPKGAITDHSIFPLKHNQIDDVLENGALFAIKNNFGKNDDFDRIEDRGCLKYADSNYVSESAKKRGNGELGSLGSGNHFIEFDYVCDIYDEKISKKFFIDKNMVFMIVHTGSRGLGHQVAIDYLKLFRQKVSKYNINIPNKELTSLPFKSDEGKMYFKAMQAASNFAFANREILGYAVCNIIGDIIKRDIDYELVYDLCHNVAKLEKHHINGKDIKLIVHRKGATRALLKSDERLSHIYKNIGQPVIIPGTMGTSSYLCIGDGNVKDTCYSICHGAGRSMGRKSAVKSMHGINLKEKLIKQGITVMSLSKIGLLEEAPIAYKNIDDIINISEDAGLIKKVARFKPLLVIKG